MMRDASQSEVESAAGPGAGRLQSRRFVFGMVVFLTLLGAGLRFFRLSNQSFWTDEISSVTTARAPLNEIGKISASLNNCPPTYFLALRPIIGNWNRDIEFRARSLSALAGALSIPLFIGVVYLWHQRWSSALLAGLLLTVNPLHIWYSQEVRAYALMLLFGVLALFTYEVARRKAFRQGAFWWAGYTVAGFGAVAIHKTGLIFPVACLLWHSWNVIWRRVRLRTLWLHSAVLIGSAVVMLVVKPSPPSKEYGRPSSILELAYTGMTFLGGYSFGPSPTEIQNLGAGSAALQHPVQVGLLAAILLLFVLIFSLRLRLLLRTKETGLLLLGVGVVGIGALVSAFPYNVRYALPALFGFLALLAIVPARLEYESGNATAGRPVGSSPEESRPFFSPLKRWLSGLLVLAIVGIGLWADAQWFFDRQYRKGDSRAVAQWLATNQDRVRSWTVLPDYLAISIQWYLEPHPEIQSHFLQPKESQTTSFPPLPDVLILGRRHHLAEPDQIVTSYESAAGKIETIRSFTGFELYVRTRDLK
jgi:hypothetical protein